MSLDIIDEKLKEYSPKTKQEEINALKEIYQEIALCGLSRSHFFKIAAFQGGTCLRILYGLKRFSEDLDFVLIDPSKKFQWNNFLSSIQLEFQSFGIDIDIIDRSQADIIIQKAFLKQNSFGKILKLKHDFLPSDKQSIKIKLEIDTNPPAGSQYETKYLTYPYPFSVITQDLPSLFASKCHCLLCRKYTKGRDWFDFSWYVSKKIKINFTLLSHALQQAGPFKNKKLHVNKMWLSQQLKSTIDTIDWNALRFDIETFLKPEERRVIENWNATFFYALVEQLQDYC